MHEINLYLSTIYKETTTRLEDIKTEQTKALRDVTETQRHLPAIIKTNGKTKSQNKVRVSHLTSLRCSLVKNYFILCFTT